MYTYVHGCARAHVVTCVVNSLEPISLMLSTVKAAPSRTPQIRQTTDDDDDDDFVIRIIDGAIVHLHHLHLLIDNAFASRQYKLSKLQYQK